VHLARGVRDQAPLRVEGRRLSGGPRLARLQLTAGAGDEPDDILVLQPPRGGHHEAIGRPQRREVIQHTVAREARHALAGAHDRPAERMARPRGLREEVVHPTLGGVFEVLDLLEHDVLLARDLLLRARGVEQHLEEEVQRGRHLLRDSARVELHELAFREAVDLSPEVVYGLAELNGRAVGGTLEEHVLEEVGDSGAVFRLVH